MDVRACLCLCLCLHRPPCVPPCRKTKFKRTKQRPRWTTKFLWQIVGSRPGYSVTVCWTYWAFVPTFDPLHAGLPAKLLRYEIEEDKCETLHDVVRRRGSEPLKLQHQTDPLKLENIYTLCKGESSKVCACALGSSTLLARSSAGRLCLFRYSRSESSASSSLKKGKQHKCYRYSKTTFPLLFWRH